MILRYGDWDKEIKLEKTMTVGDFIKEMVLTDENKEKKYYGISIKESINGKSNLIIYYQNGTVKSHHSTGIVFDYNKVIDLEVMPYYLERIITVNDIISMDADFKTEERYEPLTKQEIDKRLEEIRKKWDREEIEKNNRKKIFEDNVSEKELIICVRQLISNLEEQNLKNDKLKHEIDRCKQKEENLQQQIKWLEYRLNNKL